MAYSYIRYAGNGSTTNYVFSFPYISADHIQVRVNGVVTTLFSFLNSSTVQMATAPASGAILDIRRVTPKDTALVNFTDGSVLLERDLDLLATFDLYLAQETKDGLDAAIQQDYLGVYDALTKRIANVADPVAAQDAVTKNWVETTYTPELEAIALDAASSATAAAGSATTATTQATNAAASAVNAANSAAAAATALDNFDDRYLGQKASDPAVDNDGNALITGALYYNTTDSAMRVYTGTGWINASSAQVATMKTYVYVATAAQTTFSGNDANSSSLTYVAPYLIVSLNGLELRPVVDYTATSGLSVVLTVAAAAGDELQIQAFSGFNVANIQSSTISFQQTPTSTVRSVDVKLKEIVSIKDFGAVGDYNPTTGVGTDNSSAIQAAFNYAASLDEGVTIHFPPGNYRVASTLTLLYDKVGIEGNGATVTLTGHSTETHALFNVEHSSELAFPGFTPLAIRGLRLFSAVARKGRAFFFQGQALDRFVAQAHLQQLEIQDFYAAWAYGAYCFAIMHTECSVAGVDKVVLQLGGDSSGAHFVYDKCLFTEIGKAGGPGVGQYAFTLGGINTYKFTNCDIEASKNTIMETTGSDAYFSQCHFETDVGSIDTPLFAVNETDYGHFVFDQCTMFVWLSTSDAVPFWQAGSRMSAYSFNNCRIVAYTGITLASTTLLSQYYHPFLSNKAITFKSPMQPASGQAPLMTAAANNSFSNWDFADAYTKDWVQGGIGTSVSTVSDVPYGSANSMIVPANRYVFTGRIPIPDNSQTIMMALWVKQTAAGSPSMEIRLYNANQQQVGVTIVPWITPGSLNTWQRFQIDNFKTLNDKRAKYMDIGIVSDGTSNIRVAYPFLDFA